MRVTGAFLLGLCSFGAPALTADEKTDSPFQGTWDVVKLEQTGEKLDDFIKDSRPTMVFAGDKYTFTAGDDVEKGTFKLNPKAKTPTIDYDITEGTHKGKRQLGIYKLDGDTLTLCLAEEGAKARPTKFGTAEDAPEYVMFTLKRRKK
ncbi:MAG TPA: TIGR03067 domain-containing protein [Urbifossiella sp.]|jgi:uncharacterized protein (TIGR03067 family)|nr:TIGR03067 domain-containing protein [Urbifossiella sp.]